MAEIKCNQCGISFRVPPSRIGVRSTCSKRCDRLLKSGPDRKFQNGYIAVRVPGHPYAMHGSFVYEHILVVENRLGRYLEGTEQVHHDNEIKSDNRDENLIYCPDHAFHRNLHREKRVRAGGGDPDTQRLCAICKVPFRKGTIPYCNDCYKIWRKHGRNS